MKSNRSYRAFFFCSLVWVGLNCLPVGSDQTTEGERERMWTELAREVCDVVRVLEEQHEQKLEAPTPAQKEKVETVQARLEAASGDLPSNLEGMLCLYRSLCFLAGGDNSNAQAQAEAAIRHNFNAPEAIYNVLYRPERGKTRLDRDRAIERNRRLIEYSPYSCFCRSLDDALIQKAKDEARVAIETMDSWKERIGVALIDGLCEVMGMIPEAIKYNLWQLTGSDGVLYLRPSKTREGYGTLGEAWERQGGLYELNGEGEQAVNAYFKALVSLELKGGFKEDAARIAKKLVALLEKGAKCEKKPVSIRLDERCLEYLDEEQWIVRLLEEVRLRKWNLEGISILERYGSELGRDFSAELAELHEGWASFLQYWRNIHTYRLATTGEKVCLAFLFGKPLGQEMIEYHQQKAKELRGK